MAKFRMNHSRNGKGATGHVVRVGAAAFLLFGFLFFLLFLFRKNQPAPYEWPGTNPAERFFLPENKAPELLLHYPLFSLAYHPDRQLPLWAAYELHAQWFERGKRPKSRWQREEALPATRHPKALEALGLMAGQLAPAADFYRYRPAWKATFRTANLCPQPPSFQRACWLPAEQQIRDWATSTGSLFVVSGLIPGQVSGEELPDPDFFYKIVLDLSGPEGKGLGLLFPSHDTLLDLEAQLTTIDALERLAGIDFFPELMTDSLESLVEQGSDLQCWTP